MCVEPKKAGFYIGHYHLTCNEMLPFRKKKKPSDRHATRRLSRLASEDEEAWNSLYDHEEHWSSEGLRGLKVARI